MTVHEGGPAPAAVVFDCDGTVADTEPLTARVFDRVLARYRYRLSDTDVNEIIGRTLQQNHAYLLRHVALPPVEDFAREWYDVSYALLETDLELFDDAVTVMRDLAGAGVPIAVASSSPREHVRRVLDFGGLNDLVRAVVAYEDVAQHKPHPAPYRRATALLGVEPARAVAVEDTAVGLAAARAAGIATLAVRRHGGDPAALAGADHVVEELTMSALLQARRMAARHASGTR